MLRRLTEATRMLAQAKARFLATKVTEVRPTHQSPEAFLKSLEQALAASLDSTENAKDDSLATVYLGHVEPTRVAE